VKCRICNEKLNGYYYVSYGERYCSVECAMNGLAKDGKIKFGAPYKAECLHCGTAIFKTKLSGLVWGTEAFCSEDHLAVYLVNQGIISNKGAGE